MKKMLIVLFTVSLFLSGCNTMKGAGEDIKAGGQAISHAAEKAKP